MSYVDPTEPPPPPTRRKKRKAAPKKRRKADLGVADFISGVFTMVILGVGLVFGALWWATQEYERAGPAAAETRVTLARGAGVRTIARTLTEAGAISDKPILGVVDPALLFEWTVRLKGDGDDLKAGEYAVPAGASMAEIVAILREGRAIQHRLTAPEGLSTAEIMELVRGHERLEGDISVFPNEGELLPETYLFSSGDARDSVLRRMMEARDETLAELWASRQEGLPIKTPEEAVILASIIEKETGVSSERERVAAVFINRLRQGMRLQSDPTTIYGITQGRGPLGRDLTRSDLDQPTPWNTYVISGLPPTPIANPGRAAIAAALNPATTNELFFVADGSGGHAFAETLDEHNRNVARWRQIQRSTAQ